MKLIELFATLISSLGIVEVFKRILLDWYEHTVEAQAQEMRDIAVEVLGMATTLKLRDFDPPMTSAEGDHYLLLATKVDAYDKKLGNSISFLVNWPKIAETIKNNASLQKEGNSEWVKNIDKIRDDVNTLIDDCNRIRLSPSILLWWTHRRTK